MASFKNLTANWLQQNHPENSGYLIAFSGGADSTALLHIFSKFKHLSGMVRAIHINHGLNIQANQWQEYCQQVCGNLSIPLINYQLQLKDASENTSRVARYRVFAKELQQNEILLTGHHSQDQVETVLMKLLRGSGIKGMAGIEAIKKFDKGWLARPLLQYSPDELKQYLQENNQAWIEDDSNQNNNYRRNYIRNELIEKLEDQWPNAVNNIARTAENLKNSMELLKHYSQQKSNSLSIEKLIQLPVHLRSSLVYQWLSDKQIPLPNKAAIEQITINFIQAKPSKNPHFRNTHYQLQRWNQEIYCLKNYPIIESNKEFLWNTEEDFILPNQAGRLIFKGNKSLNLNIKFNQVGQKLKPYNQKITKTVKKLFQENQIPPWQRPLIPYIYHQQDLVSLGFNWSMAKSFQDEFELKLSTMEC